MGKFAGVFSGISNAKPMGGFLDRLGLGKHKIALTRFAVKTSESDGQTILEADFQILESSVPGLAGSYRGYPWFLDAAKHGKDYERDRAKKFIEAVIGCFTDANDKAALANLCQQITPGSAGIDVQTFGDLMAYDEQPLSGVVLIADITERHNKKKDKTYSNAEWISVPQTLQQVLERGAQIKAMKAQVAAQVAASHPNAPGGAPQVPHASQPQLQTQPVTAGIPSQPNILPGQGFQFPGAGPVNPFPVQPTTAPAPGPGLNFAALQAQLRGQNGQG